MSTLGFPKDHHLRKDAHFQRVYAARVYAADDVLVVNGCENGLAHPRLGLSVSRKVGNAVVRNAWKRRIREAFRLACEVLPAGVDFVVRPQKKAVLDFHAIAKSLPELAARIAWKLARSRQ
ncbi:MAG: ribonuclease P protein component [Planctomycetales bacterium]|nr:ribonuclease P protein component [Planctomycetales bacterium]